jgi:hypothetical protein
MRSAISAGTTVLCLLFLTAAPSALGASRVAQPSRTQPPESLSTRFCDALQTLPETRKAQCCGTSPTGGVANECARELNRSLRDHAITLDPADVERCAAESSRALDGCDWVTPYLPRTAASCRGILHGRLEAGARCRSSLECRDGLACRGNGTTVPGVCAPPGVAGVSCGGAPDTLQTYARQTDDDMRHPECAGFCFRGRCSPFISLGGMCSADQQCAPGSHCASRRCVKGPRPTLGEACEGTTCDGALVCVEGHCSQAKKAGERCTQPFECEATCLSPSSDSPGTCGMKCSAWPPTGYTPPVNASLPVGMDHPIVPSAP